MAKHDEVLIVGCGPVGMVLAMDLAWRGVPVTVIEKRDRREMPQSAKCNHISARTMEQFRRLGFVQVIRDAKGLPYDYANDVIHRTRGASGYEFARIHIPCRQDRYTDKSGPDGWWPTPEPPHRLNQQYMEPVLFEEFLKTPGITFLNQTEVTDWEQDDAGVTAQYTDLASGVSGEIRAAYIVGCDGGPSMVRKKMGAVFSGDSFLYNVQSSVVRAPELLGRLGPNPPWMVYVSNKERKGSIFALDGKEHWLIHTLLEDGETSAELDRLPAMRTMLGVDENFPLEVISIQDWTARRLVADKQRERRAFICGDAAHAWVPMAGYGMNAGIASALDLSWQLAAVCNGWAPEGLLDAFEAERGPIEQQVSHYAMGHALGLIKRRAEVPPALEDEGAEGDQAREEYGKINYEADVQQFCCGGLNFGYFYDQSPIIVYDGESAPAYTMYDYTASTVPGCRLPYFELADGTPLYDALGPEYTLLRFDKSVDVGPLMAAAEERGFPMQLLDIEGDYPEVYRHKLTVARPDWHVAWRDDACPQAPLELVDKLRGAKIR